MIVIIQISAIFLTLSANKVVYHRPGIISTITTICKSLDITIISNNDNNRFLYSTSIVINDPDSSSAIRRIIGKLKGEKKERERVMGGDKFNGDPLPHRQSPHFPGDSRQEF